MTIDLSQIDEAALKGASRKDLIALAKQLAQLKYKAGQVGPQTDDELHALIKEKWGIHVPRIAVDVDRGHCAPFDMIADAYFERITAGLAVGGRESGKTFNVAIIHALNARFKPGYEGISAGAVSEQSKRAYAALKKLNRVWGGLDAETKETDVESSLQSETVYKNSSVVSILGGTVAQLNGPHSNLLHRDEVELFRRDAFDEANNITRTGVTTDGRPIKAIDLLTSSLKYAKGLLQEILERVDEAVKAGNDPPYKVYKWGVAETIAPVPNCRYDPKNADLPEDELCPCERQVNGVWADGSPRTLASVCNGRFARGDGYRPLDPDIINKFQQNSRGVWEAQQECIRPAAEGLILENFSKDRHGVRDYMPDPENGLIFLSADFGGTNAHAANWYQLTNRMVPCKSYDGGFFVIPANSLVAFDEVYVTEVGNVDFGEMVKASEALWKQSFPYFNVTERYADIAAKAARLDWRSIGLPTVWRITREIEEHISKCVVLVDNFRFYVDVDRCPMFVEEAEAWQRDPATGKQRDTFNHCVAGDTIVQTRQGLRLARDLDGEIVEVLTEGGEYRPAEWKSYGVRDVYEVEFDNGETIRATDGHQWIVTHRGGNERVTTLDLVGRTVPTQAASWKIENQFIYNEGVKNGLIYGDGTRGTINGHTYSWMNQYGDENCAIVEDYFIDRHSERKLSEHLGVKISTKTFPPHFKDLPPNDHPDYVRGFIAGLIAADGAVNKQGCCYISTSKKDDVNEIISLCRSVGVVVANVECYQPTESSYPNAKPNYRIWITKASLDETLLLKPSHRENGLRVGKYIKRYTRKVVAVRPAGREEVFCCEEPVTNSWTTGTGLITSNCMSNFRYAVANIDRREKIYNMRGSSDHAAAAPQTKDREHNLDVHQVPATGPASRDLRDLPDMIPMHQGASAYDIRIW